ncbi:ABC transporter ATP-binding protein, partial [Flavonifractor plautii]|nr:ABC transporter ATP-binding protein [Flavonifractor plautii]
SDTVSSKVDVSEMMGSEVYLHVNAVGRDVVLRIPTTDLPAEHRAGIPYSTEINFAFRPELIHLFDPETEKNLMY